MLVPFVITFLSGLCFAAQAQKLNGPLASDPGSGGGDVHSFVLDVAEWRFAYAADQEVAGSIELFAGTLDGSLAPIRISGPLVTNGDVDASSPRFSPDGAWVVYLADAEEDARTELFSAPGDGGAPARRLNGALVEGGEVDPSELPPFLITSDSLRVIYCADQEVDGRFELWSVPIDGSTPAVRVSGSMQAEGDIVRAGYQLSQGGDRVAFVADREVDRRADLYVVPVDGSQPPLRLNPPFQLERGIAGERGPGFLFTADGTRIVYRADQDFDVYTLYSVPVDGSSAPVAVTIPLANRDVYEFALTSAGRAVFVGDLRADNGFELFSAPDDFSSPMVRINGGSVAGGDVVSASSGPTFRVEPDGMHVVFSADKLVNDQVELFRVPVSGGSEPVPLGGSPRAGGDVGSFLFDREGTHVVYLADGRNFADELFSTPLDHPSPRRLNERLVQGGNVRSDFRAVAGRVLFTADGEENERFELWCAPLDGWPPHVRSADGTQTLARGPVRLHPALASTSDIAYGTFVLTSAGRALWRGDHAVTSKYELASRSADGSGALVTLNSALTAGPPRGAILEFAARDGHVYYTGNQLDALRDGLFRVVPEEAPAYEVLADFPAQRAALEFLHTPDGGRLLVLADLAVRGQYELYVLPSDGSVAPLRLSPTGALPASDVSEGFRLTSDGIRVLFRGNLLSAGIELFSAPVDGSAPAVRLHGDLTAERHVREFQPTADGLRAVFLADLVVDERVELFSAPLDGSSPPLALSGVLQVDGDAGPFVLSPDGDRVYFVADAVTDGLFELYSVPTDGSQPPMPLSLSAQGRVHLELLITPDGARLLYKSQVGEAVDLYSVPADGSAAPTLLHPGHLVNGRIQEVVLVDGGAAAAYVELEELTRNPGLFRVQVDGSSAPVALAPRQPTDQDGIEGLRASSDGSQLLYFVQPTGVLGDELRQVATDAGSAPRVLRTVTGYPDYAFSPAGGHVVVRTETTLNGTIELYAAPSDGSTPLVRVSDPLVPGGNVMAFAFGPGAADILYRADQEQDELFELYRVILP